MDPIVYDAIVVGARCAGSPTAMLLARREYRVLLLDRNRFPSDIMSTHRIKPGGVLRLRLLSDAIDAVDSGKNDLVEAMQHYELARNTAARPYYDVVHLETPSPLNALGVKGAGEGGVIPGPAVIAEAVDDALAPLGVRIREMPLDPERLRRLIDDAAARVTRT